MTTDAVDTPQPTATAAVAPRITAGEEARTLAEVSTTGTLSTLAIEPAGHPFGSVAPFAVADDGNLLLCLSSLAEHSRNLAADDRCSVLVTEPAGDDGRMAAGRVTVLGRARRLERGTPDDEAARERWLSVHPDGQYAHFGDFSMWVLDVSHIRWIGGFGRMTWCSVEEWASARPDPVLPIAAGAVDHLNDDHPDALVAMARAFAGHPDATSAAATRIDRLGIDLQVETPRGWVEARVAFAEPVPSAEALRGACVELTQRARASITET